MNRLTSPFARQVGFQTGTDPTQYGGAAPGISEESERKYISPAGAGYLTSADRALVPPQKPGGRLGVARSGSEYIKSKQPHEVPPRYVLGDEWKPQTQSWSPERIADMQAQLVDAGLLDPDDYQRGFWDQTSAQAYRQLLGYSNVSGLEAHQTLQRIGQVRSKYGSTQEKARIRQPFIAELTDPAALNDLIDDIAVRRMGRGLTPQEKERFANSFRGLEESAQRQAYEMSGSGLPGGPGGTVTAPNAPGQAEQFVTENRPDDVAAYQYLQAFKSFENLISRTRR